MREYRLFKRSLKCYTTILGLIYVILSMIYFLVGPKMTVILTAAIVPTWFQFVTFLSGPEKQRMLHDVQISTSRGEFNFFARVGLISSLLNVGLSMAAIVAAYKENPFLLKDISWYFSALCTKVVLITTIGHIRRDKDPTELIMYEIFKGLQIYVQLFRSRSI